jgi:NADPH-dependent glutamate synthase beta subunit-like oxidoreductase
VTERFGPESRRGPDEHVLDRIKGEAARRRCRGVEELSGMDRIVGRTNAQEGAPRVAIIGSGPAGLAAAHDLALFGLRPVVFEMEPVPAGMLAVGIPAYRLPRDLIAAEIDVIRSLGVEFRCGVQVGKDTTLQELRTDHAATIIAVGAKYSRRLPVPGGDGPGVLGGVEVLRNVALGTAVPLGERVVVIGGGNVAYDVARSVIRQAEMDVSRTALRQAGVREVNMVSLESLEEMPADDVEIIEGEQEGVRRHHRLGPKEILRNADGTVRAVVFQRALRVFDESGRFAPEFDEHDTVTIDADTVLWAIGQRPDLSFIPQNGDIRLDKRGLIECDAEATTTTASDVFVAGDIATGPSLLIHAVASGKRAARAVHQYLTGRSIEADETMLHSALHDYRREADYEKHPRQPVPTLEAARRRTSQDAIVETGYTPPTACLEASRCLDCGINTIFDSDKCILCGGCADICPELCLRLVSVSALHHDEQLASLINARYPGEHLEEASAILKDESNCIRCGLCAERCPVDAITMERMTFENSWAEISA